MKFTVEQIRDIFKLPRVVAHLPYPNARIEEGVAISTPSASFISQYEPVVSDLMIGGRFLPIPPMIELGLVKNIVQTPVAGRDFTVKEIISAEDYRVNIKGVIVNTEGDEGLVAQGLPMDWLLWLNDLVRRNESLEVECELLNDLGIFQVVVQEFKPVFDGFHNAFAYELSCLSDTVFELELIEG